MPTVKPKSKLTKAQQKRFDSKFRKVMHEFKLKKLKSHDKIVINRLQAIAIAFSEARKTVSK